MNVFYAQFDFLRMVTCSTCKLELHLNFVNFVIYKNSAWRAAALCFEPCWCCRGIPKGLALGTRGAEDRLCNLRGLARSSADKLPKERVRGAGRSKMARPAAAYARAVSHGPRLLSQSCSSCEHGTTTYAQSQCAAHRDPFSPQYW